MPVNHQPGRIQAIEHETLNLEHKMDPASADGRESSILPLLKTHSRSPPPRSLHAGHTALPRK